MPVQDRMLYPIDLISDYNQNWIKCKVDVDPHECKTLDLDDETVFDLTGTKICTLNDTE